MTETTYTVDISKINYQKLSEYEKLGEALEILVQRYKTVNVGSLGKSVLGRSIPVITVGKSMSNKGVMYVGGIRGYDVITPCVLMRYIFDYAEFLENGKRLYNISMPYLYENRTIHIVPLLNPDGAFIRKNGADGIPGGDRLCTITGGADFSAWGYNARGVDLWHNFTKSERAEERDGLSPESEPECECLCSYLRMFDEIETVLSFGVDDSRIICSSGGLTATRSMAMGRLISRMSGTILSKPFENDRNLGTLTDFFIRQLKKPAFSCGCIAEGEDRPTDSEEYIKAYAAFREVLFSTGVLI